MFSFSKSFNIISVFFVLMNFSEQKKQVLSREDRSRKGSIDKRIVKLCNIINSSNDYYTTSSCSGRIMLYARKSFKKNETEWIYVSHEAVKFSDVKKALNKAGIPKETMWLKAEPMIIHICAKTDGKAAEMLNIAKECGFKRAGIIAMGKRTIIEITSTEIIDALISGKGKMLVDDAYVKKLISEGNKKLKRNFERIKKFEDKAKGELRIK